MQAPRFWYQKNALAYLLLPLSALFCAISWLRRKFYQRFAAKTQLPVIIVGNISVGGTGKTPMVIWLSRWLQQQGYRPGIISRGYGSQLSHYPAEVFPDSDPHLYGDEPVLIAQHCRCPLVIAPKRPLAAQMLAKTCDILISDDGLQHYALDRYLEIALIDGKRGLGNGFCLPAGPLRELPSRLATVDFCLHKGQLAQPLPYQHYGFYYRTAPLKALKHETDIPQRGQSVHAVAGIADPESFFQTLRAQGWQVIPHAFADHHAYQAEDLIFTPALPIIMTEKDAVKCQSMAPDNSWYLPIEIEVDSTFIQRLSEHMSRCNN